MLIPPRLNKLLHLLLEQGEPVSVNRLAEQVGSSRRTVFRELENIDQVLEPHGLSLETVPGRGIRLTGEPDGRDSLLESLDSVGEPEPTDKRERLYRLLLELLRSPELQKLHYYAALFKVSEATVSNDLEAADEWLSKYGLTLVRKPGAGMELEGSEADCRRALIKLLDQNTEIGQLERLGRHGFLDPEVLDEVCAILRGIHDPLFERMTGDSQSRMAIYLSVITERIRGGRALLEAPPQVETEASRPLANRLADALESSFPISLSTAERVSIAIEISGARVRYMDAHQEAELLLDNFELQRLAYLMIDRFDPELAYELKMDETLVKGLAFHLKSAVVRLRHGLELEDPSLDQMIRGYPEVYDKSREAAKVLWEEYRRPVSDSEAGFLAMHFGAAVMRLNARKTHKRTVHVGVLCVNGIGVSYMMVSQIKNRFKNDVDVEVCVKEDMSSQGRFDFYVASMPLRAEGVTVLETQAILTEEDFERIHFEITQRACLRDNGQLPPASADFSGFLERLEGIVRDTRILLDQFHVVRVQADYSFNDLVKLVGYHFGNSPENGRQIYEDLLFRERIATQVIADYGFVLLHARTEGVSDPIFSLLSPEGGAFTDPYLQRVSTVVVMLVPMDSPPERGRLMGTISSAFVEDPVLLQAARSGDAVQVRAELEKTLQEFLLETLKPLNI